MRRSSTSRSRGQKCELNDGLATPNSDTDRANTVNRPGSSGDFHRSRRASVHDEWQITERRYLSEGSMARLDANDHDGNTNERR
jgi:hypothetical protein